ncbi:MAG TPA: hypothetical protein VJP45_02125 [Candidatus Limnocylindria bacterium]|nr:hypothetical protein [Candidatus Limnocylindria bacterium]
MNAATNTETAPRTQHARWPHLPAQPWKFVGQWREVYQAIPGDPSCPVQPGTSCDHCGQAISNVYGFVATQTGERFKVGCDCVAKMIHEIAVPSKALAAAEKAAREAKNAAARDRAAAKAASVRAQLETLLADENTRAKLSAIPHPNTYRAARGETLLDSCEWMAANAGAAGRAKALKLVLGA